MIVREHDVHFGVGAVAWHPDSLVLMIGTENGDLICVPFTGTTNTVSDERKALCLNQTDPIHKVKYSPSGEQLVIIYGGGIKVLDASLQGRAEHVLLEADLRITKNIDTLPVGIHFYDEGTIIVTYHDSRDGIKVYTSEDSYQVPRDFEARLSSPLSPTRKLLAVANFHDGIDWYNARQGKYILTTWFDTKEPFRVPIHFTGINTMIAGHSQGRLALANPKTLVNPQRMHTVFDANRSPYKEGTAKRKTWLRIVYEVYNPAADLVGTDEAVEKAAADTIIVKAVPAAWVVEATCVKEATCIEEAARVKEAACVKEATRVKEAAHVKEATCVAKDAPTAHDIP
ncbi:hypothetical protein DXG01_001959, partial [Tephrocybe rancida]